MSCTRPSTRQNSFPSVRGMSSMASCLLAVMSQRMPSKFGGIWSIFINMSMRSQIECWQQLKSHKAGTIHHITNLLLCLQCTRSYFCVHSWLFAIGICIFLREWPILRFEAKPENLGMCVQCTNSGSLVSASDEFFGSRHHSAFFLT